MSLRLTLSRKLFLAFFSALVFVVAAFVVIIRFNVERGFRHYVSATDRRDLKALAHALSIYYRQRGSWDAARGTGPLRSIPAATPLDSPGENPPGRSSDGAGDGTANPLRRLPFILPDLAPRLTLLDAHGNPVWGSPPGPNAFKQPVVARNREVGILYLRPEHGASTDLERQFLRQQQSALVITGGLILLLSAMAAAWLSSQLLVPIRNLLESHRALRRGEFAHRLKSIRDDELGELVDDFNSLAQTLERNESMRRQWLADMAHELRTPLAVLRAELESIEDGVYALDMHRIHVLHGDVLQLSKLVGDLQDLALSDIGALSYRLERLDLHQLLEQTCTSMEARCQQNGLTLEKHLEPGPAPFEADRGRLSQLFSNLLENSIRYTDPGGRIRVSLERQGQGYRTVIEDAKPGVPDWAMPKLFDRLFRVDRSRSRSQGGTGLGLSICQNIVQAHQGHIRAEPSDLGGLKLIIDWPTRA